MRPPTRPRLAAAATPLVLVLLVVCAAPAPGQVPSGALYGVVTDDAGTALAGATVTLRGEQGPPLAQVTNDRGEFRFFGLHPGLYQGTVELAGYSTNEYPDIPLHVGGSTTIHVSMTPTDDDSITLTAECPLLDERKISNGVTVTREELDTIPTARDPWSILGQAPGVLLDRIDVGGSESGHPAVARAPGLGSDQNTYSVDGVSVGDPESLATTPTFYDFDSFEEMQVTTGGTGATIPTGGVVLNMVTRRATDRWRWSGRYLRGDGDWQPSPSALDLGSGQTDFVPSPRFETSQEYGADAGGPLTRDRLWIWSGYHRIDTNVTLEEPPTLFQQGSGDRDVENAVAKLDLAIAASHRVQAYAHRSDAAIAQVGGGPTRSLEATWDLEAPTTIYKLEDDHLFPSGILLQTQLSRVDGDLDLAPLGGGAQPSIDAAGVFREGFLASESDRRRDQAKVDASAFLDRGSIGHEVKVGAGWREADVRSASRWGTTGSVFAADPSAAGAATLFLFRPAASRVELESRAAYLQDTLSVGGLIADVGIRYQRERGARVARELAAHSLRPDLLPASIDEGAGGDVSWETLVPRVGLTYALGEEHTTFLRASYSRFADQLGTAVYADAVAAPDLSPFSFASVSFLDFDGDRLPGSSEPQTADDALLPSTVIDAGLDAPTVEEILLIAEHAGAGCFSVGTRLSWRAYDGVPEARPLVRDATGAVRVAERADYALDATLAGSLPDGAAYSAPVFALRPELEPLDSRFLTNGERESEYLGATVWFERRLRARWQVRGFVNVREETRVVPAAFQRFDDPTAIVGFEDADGAPFAPQSALADQDGAFLHAGWDYSIAGLYRARAGWSAAILAHGRQGYPLPYFETTTSSDGLARSVAVTAADDPPRLDDLHLLDLRLEKEMRLRDAAVTLSLDAFNLLNETPAVERGLELATPGADFLREVVSPRIVRLGVRIRIE